MLSGLGARLLGVRLCVLVCLESGPLGAATPEEAWPCPSITRVGWTLARCLPPPLFVPLAGAGQLDAARTREAGQGSPGPPGPASHPAPPPSFPVFTFNGTTGGGLGKLTLNREKGRERTTFDEPIWLV